MCEEAKQAAGRLFDPNDIELKLVKTRTHKLNVDYNQTYEVETEKRAAILREILGSLGEGSFIQGPIAFHYGQHTRLGRNFFANFNLTVQDDARVFIGDNCYFGPNVTLVTPIHPLLAAERNRIDGPDGKPHRLCYAKPIYIGNSCWLGASVTVCPGVTIGENCVIGAGSVVTEDIPANSLAAGVPCRVIRTLSDADSLRHHPELLGDYTIPEPPTR